MTNLSQREPMKKGAAAAAAVLPERREDAITPRRAPFTYDKAKRWFLRGIIYAVLIASALVMVFPMAWMYSTSFKKEFYSHGDQMRWFPPVWQSKYWTLDHYNELVSRAGAKSSGAADDFVQATVNTAIFAAGGTLLNVLICSMAGYALAKKRFRGRNLILMSIIATMMIPGIMVLLPDFVITMRYFHGYNNFAGLILPGLASSFGVFLMRQYMLGIPDELLDAARVDGAGEVRTFFMIVIPLATPILVAYGILQVLSHWNNMLWPLVITKDLLVLQVALLNLMEIGSQRIGPAMAGAAISSTPIIVLFFLVRKQFVQAMTSGALKG
jgi:multiple sugar transport system permease protein